MFPPTAHLLLLYSAVAIASVSGLGISSPPAASSRRAAQGPRFKLPAPIPADTVGPIDWSTLPPAYVSYPYHYAPTQQQPLPNPNPKLKQTAATTPSSNDDTNQSTYDYEDEIQALYTRVDWRNRTFPLIPGPQQQQQQQTTVTSNPSRASSTRLQNFITTPQNQGICASCWAFAATALIESMIRVEHGIWSKRSESDVHDGVGASCESIGNIHETLAWVAGVWDDLYGGGSGGNGGNGGVAPGIADWPCDPYDDSSLSHGYVHCEDRQGRATHIPSYTPLGLISDQKRWLREYGPIVATFVLYEDFERWGNDFGKNGGKQPVYRYDGRSGNTTTGNHIALVVGYDDRWGEIEGQRAGGAWIVKNSWGSSWGDGGYVYFGYNECNIDGWIKYGITNVSPDPWSRKRHQNGNMMQSNNGGMHRNFELLLANTVNDTTPPGFTYFSRDGTSERWNTVPQVVQVVNETEVMLGQPVIIGTSYNGGDFHALVRIRDLELGNSESTIQHWILRDSSYSKSLWKLEGEIKTGNAAAEIAGFPGLVQADDSGLVMVVRHSDGSLREWRRPPPSGSNPSPPWSLVSTIFTPASSGISILQSGPSLIQSNIGHSLYDPNGTSQKSSNLYVVALRSDGKMQLFWRAGAGTDGTSNSNLQWKAGDIFGENLAIPFDSSEQASDNSGPVMIQSFHDTQNEISIGDFHLAVVSPKTGKVEHWRRKNGDIHVRDPLDRDENTINRENRKWELLEEIGGESEQVQVKNVWALVQGSFNGKIHMVTELFDVGSALWEWDPYGEDGKRWKVVENLPRV